MSRRLRAVWCGSKQQCPATGPASMVANTRTYRPFICTQPLPAWPLWRATCLLLRCAPCFHMHFSAAAHVIYLAALSSQRGVVSGPASTVATVVCQTEQQQKSLCACLHRKRIPRKFCTRYLLYLQEALRAAARIEDLMAYQEVCPSQHFVFVSAGFKALDFCTFCRGSFVCPHTYGTAMQPARLLQPVRHALGYVLLNAGKAAEAELVYEENLAEHPESGFGLFGLSQSLYAQGRTKDADQVMNSKFKQAWKFSDRELQSSSPAFSD